MSKPVSGQTSCSPGTAVKLISAEHDGSIVVYTAGSFSVYFGDSTVSSTTGFPSRTPSISGTFTLTYSGSHDAPFELWAVLDPAAPANQIVYYLAVE